MEHRLADLLDNLLSFDITAHLLGHDFVQQALVAAALLGLVAGLIGPFIVMRQMSFAVHGSSELSLTGAAFALLVGFGVGTGALIGSALAAALFGVLGRRDRERDSVIGVVAAQAVQIVGALLVMSLLITPAAAAARVVASTAAAVVTSVVFAEVSAVGGLVLSLAPGVPVSVFVASISFLIYLVCWLIGRRRSAAA
jgi:ABC-type Mn2+/Zn2+ transport system permease subunit